MESITSKEDYKRFFKDSTKEYSSREPRAFCYDLSMDLIQKARKKKPNDWYTDEHTIDGILLLLYCWNFAARKTKELTRESVRELLMNNKEDLKSLESSTITSFSKKDEIIKRIFKSFKEEMGQTGASKALCLLNPELFMMWDTKIRDGLNKVFTGIQKGDEESYLTFLKEMRKVIKNYHLDEKITPSSNINKKLDEFHYVVFVKK